MLATSLARHLKIPEILDRHLSVLKVHRPYSDADHVLTQAFNLFVGGGCIEDIGNLQGSEAVRRMLGAARIPDPTTCGDYLRRFGRRALADLDHAIDEIHEAAWRKRYGRKKVAQAVVDLDSHVREVFGVRKEGADFSYKGTWSYHPLVISLAGTHECLRLVNRPGNAHSAWGAGRPLAEVLELLGRRFREVVVRGDSGFYTREIFDTCEAYGQKFAIVARSADRLHEIADSLPESAWTLFLPKERRKPPTPSERRRKRRRDRKRATARRRGKRDLRLKKQWVAEADYCLFGTKKTYRLIIRRQRIEERDGQGHLFELWRYRFALTNIRDRTASEVLDLTYERCDQEKVIEQLQNGIAAMRMPTGTLMANAAFLTIARLAHNLKSWLAQLALPQETLRWEWKRFRHAFVYVAARIIRAARQTIVRLSDSHRWRDAILLAHGRLQT